MPQTQWQTELAQLRKDHRASAQEITQRAVDLLLDVVGDSIPGGAISYRQWLLRLCRDLVAARPSVSGLFRLVNDMLWACHRAMGSQDIRQDALAFLQDYPAKSELALEQLAQQAAAALAPYRTILTYSRSVTLLRALTAMASAKRRFRVLCGEGRPAFEGQALASELTWAGVDVTLGVDMALFGWLTEANAVVVGARGLSSAGVVNKIGSAALMRAAVELEIPCVVLCTSAKLLPGDYVLEQQLVSGPPDEIMPVSDNHLTVRNASFDITPLDMISTVVTEQGPLGGEDLQQALESVRTYPGLRGN